MGKDLNGKEIGEGLSQRKNGKYSARYRNNSGKRIEKYFDKLHEAKRWLADCQYENRHGNIANGSQMTYDTWFKFWLTDIKGSMIRETTYETYVDEYNYRIKDYIGDMPLSDIKPLHCQNILNQANNKGYSYATMVRTRAKLYTTMQAAVDNELIVKNPVSRNVKVPKPKEKKATVVLTRSEQNAFLEAARRYAYYNHFRFVLETGLRCGELMGLKWSDVDWKNRTIYVQRTVLYLNNRFVVHPTKTKSGRRVIPLTQTAYDILSEIKAKKTRKFSSDFYDHIFVNGNGNPVSSSNYYKMLKLIRKQTGINELSMHVLRHSFATRCIEANMNPKTLQRIMGHANLEITMNLYVHVTDDTIKNEMVKFEKAMGVKWA